MKYNLYYSHIYKSRSNLANRNYDALIFVTTMAGKWWEISYSMYTLAHKLQWLHVASIIIANMRWYYNNILWSQFCDTHNFFMTDESCMFGLDYACMYACTAMINKQKFCLHKRSSHSQTSQQRFIIATIGIIIMR